MINYNITFGVVNSVLKSLYFETNTVARKFEKLVSKTDTFRYISQSCVIYNCLLFTYYTVCCKENNSGVFTVLNLQAGIRNRRKPEK